MKFFLLILVSLFSTNSAFAIANKAKLKVGKVSAVITDGKSEVTNFIISKSGTLFVVGLGISKVVVSSNPKSTQIVSSLTFAVPEDDFISGETYDLVPPANSLNDDGYNLNVILTAFKLSGTKTWAVSTIAEGVVDPRAFGSLKVVKYDSETGEFKGILKAYFSPSSSGASGKEKISDKRIPYVATIQGTLE